MGNRWAKIAAMAQKELKIFPPCGITAHIMT
jgi:hypothetical protein